MDYDALKSVKLQERSHKPQAGGKFMKKLILLI